MWLQILLVLLVVEFKFVHLRGIRWRKYYFNVVNYTSASSRVNYIWNVSVLFWLSHWSLLNLILSWSLNPSHVNPFFINRFKHLLSSVIFYFSTSLAWMCRGWPLLRFHRSCLIHLSSQSLPRCLLMLLQCSCRLALATHYSLAYRILSVEVVRRNSTFGIILSITLVNIISCGLS